MSASALPSAPPESPAWPPSCASRRIKRHHLRLDIAERRAVAALLAAAPALRVLRRAGPRGGRRSAARVAPAVGAQVERRARRRQAEHLFARAKFLARVCMRRQGVVGRVAAQGFARQLVAGSDDGLHRQPDRLDAAQPAGRQRCRRSTPSSTATGRGRAHAPAARADRVPGSPPRWRAYSALPMISGRSGLPSRSAWPLLSSAPM